MTDIKQDLNAKNPNNDEVYNWPRLTSYRKRLLVDISSSNFEVPETFYCRGFMHEGTNTEDFDFIMSEETSSIGAQKFEPFVPYAMEIKEIIKATTTITANIILLA